MMITTGLVATKSKIFMGGFKQSSPLFSGDQESFFNAVTLEARMKKNKGLNVGIVWDL